MSVFSNLKMSFAVLIFRRFQSINLLLVGFCFTFIRFSFSFSSFYFVGWNQFFLTPFTRKYTTNWWTTMMMTTTARNFVFIFYSTAIALWASEKLNHTHTRRHHTKNSNIDTTTMIQHLGLYKCVQRRRQRRRRPRRRCYCKQ